MLDWFLRPRGIAAPVAIMVSVIEGKPIPLG